MKARIIKNQSTGANGVLFVQMRGIWKIFIEDVALTLGLK